MKGSIKAKEIRSKSKDELKSQVAVLKKELASLRVAQVTSGQQGKVGKIGATRKDIARVLTVLRQVEKSDARAAAADAKYKPLDLRAKKTRAIRRRLTPAQRNAKTLRQKKKEAAFPLRKYAVKSA
eukprot:Clim_evm157s157 gene=Clim_evmTU157s157